MRILITGAQGFLGSAVTKRLAADGHQVMTPSCDLRNGQQALRLFESCGGLDRVYHFAADVGGAPYLADHPECHRNNTLMTTAVLYAAHKTGARLLFPSSVNIYGDGAYAFERRTSEFLVHKRRGVQIVRLGNIVGPGCPWRGGRERVVPALCRKVLEGGVVMVYGDGTERRSILHIEDAVTGMIEALENGDGVVDLGLPPLTVGQILDVIEEVHGHKVERCYKAAPPDTLDLDRARFDWTPSITAVEAVADTYRWVASEMLMGES